MIDFDELVLGPCQDILGRPITVYPIASRPGSGPFEARGIYASRDVDIATEEGVIVSQVVTIGIRIADFVDPATGKAIPPIQRDELVLVGDRAGPMRFAVKDPPRRDGQGGASLVVALLNPFPAAS